MSLRLAASDDEDEEEYVSDGKSYFTDSSDDEEMEKRLAPRTAPSVGMGFWLVCPSMVAKLWRQSTRLGPQSVADKLAWSDKETFTPRRNNCVLHPVEAELPVTLCQTLQKLTCGHLSLRIGEEAGEHP